jgi:hypothetical protein
MSQRAGARASQRGDNPDDHRATGRDGGRGAGARGHC